MTESAFATVLIAGVVGISSAVEGLGQGSATAPVTGTPPLDAPLFRFVFACPY